MSKKPEKYLKKLKRYKEVKNEDDYWKKHKTLKKAIGGVYKNLKRFFSNPEKGINTFEEILDEAVRIKLITKEYKEKQMKRLLDELTKPSQFKQAVRKKFEKAKDKILRRKKNIKPKEITEEEKKKREKEYTNKIKKKVEKKIEDDNKEDSK